MENLICRELTDRMGGLVDSISTYKSTFLHLSSETTTLKNLFYDEDALLSTKNGQG